MFMPQAERSAPNPLCISAQMLRARARCVLSAGQSCASGQVSARYSAIASVSQMASPSSINRGTLPVGFNGLMVRLKLEGASKESKRTMTSSNAMPAWVMSTQGRIDHDE